MPLIPITLAWLIGIWIASRVALPTVALGFAAVAAIVVDEPDERDNYTNLRVEAGKVTIADQPTRTVKGLVLVQAPPFTDSRYGDRIRAEGKLQTPANTGDFDYREYLARRDVYSTPHLRWVQVSCRAHA